MCVFCAWTGMYMWNVRFTRRNSRNSLKLLNTGGDGSGGPKGGTDCSLNIFSLYDLSCLLYMTRANMCWNWERALDGVKSDSSPFSNSWNTIVTMSLPMCRFRSSFFYFVLFWFICFCLIQCFSFFVLLLKKNKTKASFYLLTRVWHERQQRGHMEHDLMAFIDRVDRVLSSSVSFFVRSLLVCFFSLNKSSLIVEYCVLKYYVVSFGG